MCLKELYDKMQIKHITDNIETLLCSSCEKYLKKNNPEFVLPENFSVDLQSTRDNKHGDFTSNLSMRLAGKVGIAPNTLAGEIAHSFLLSLKKSVIADMIGKVESKGGFINFWLSDHYFSVLLTSIRSADRDYGKNENGKGEKINLEYVSANPTGPLTIAHGRQAAIGDTLSRILRFNGYDVTNEYYLNDFGRQINMLGKSLGIRYRNLLGHHDAMPEDGYMGDYIIDIARCLLEEKGKILLDKDNEIFFRRYAVDHIMKLIHKDLEDFGVAFDTWTSQAKIENRNDVSDILEKLETDGYIYKKDGASWFRSTDFSDDKDRVVIKNDGSFTYLAPDIAYHENKYARGFSKLIDLLGPDHHGYIKRMKAAVQALGHNAGTLDILIVQLVTLLRDGQTVSMSTRRGEFISLREIIDEIGKDVARFFFLSRRLDSHLDFDIELAKKESAENPVYYIQYAHARICSIQKYGRKNFLKLMFTKTDLGILQKKEEKALIRKLSEFPVAVSSAAQSLEPNRIVVYLH
jgi:arginyl-tRNA synthetase